MSTSVDLSRYDYLEEELLISGTARAYALDGELGNHGRWNSVPTPQLSAAYTVRVLVRRPQSPDKFNGTVVVEWMNVSGGLDVPTEWLYAHPELMQEGYAYVGVTAQLTGAAALQSWEDGPGDRYADIFHPGDSFSYSIFSQAGAAIRSPDPGYPAPLGPLTPHIKALVASGESQSAQRLFSYYNTIQPLANIYDGFFIHSYLGGPAALSQSSGGGLPLATLDPPPGVPETPDISLPFGAGAVLRDDLDTPVLMLMTESDILFPGILSPIAVHNQQDHQYFRLWEVAGTAHADSHVVALGMQESVKSGHSEKGLDCGEEPPPNDGQPHIYAVRAAIHAVNSWVRSGQEPANAPRLEVGTRLLFPPIVRDSQTGLARGGVRMPQIAVPVATYTGSRPIRGLFGGVFCVFFGATDYWNGDSDLHDNKFLADPSPAPEPDLNQIYADRDGYLRKFMQAVDDSVAEGFLRPRDAEAALDWARSFAWPGTSGRPSH
jgi:Alpha/beta hydrolase domain